jgi:cell division ATPase FtsA
LATLTLLEPTHQNAGLFTALNGQIFEIDVSQDISVKLGMLYMDASNLKIEFNEADFKDIDEGILTNMALKLDCDVSEVKRRVLPKKSTAAKITARVKETIIKPKEEEDAPSDE